MEALLRAIYNYRGFISGSVKRDFQSRYQTSFLGAAWLVIQPLSMILVYTLVFSQVMGARLPDATGGFSYSIYLCAGTLTWSLFSEILGRSKNVFIDNANILKKLSFPRICLPIILTATSLINFSIIFAIFLVFLIITNNFPGWIIFDVVPLLIIQVFFTLSLGLVIGVLNVFFRDVGQFIDVCLQFLFWFTPIVYTISLVPEWAKEVLLFNPMARIIMGYQNIFVHQESPNWYSLWPILVLTLILFFVGIKLYRKHAKDMVDEL